MLLKLEIGERLTIVTPQGIVVVGAYEDIGSTLITVGRKEGYTLIHEVEVNEDDGQENFLTWIKPTIVSEERDVPPPSQLNP